MISVVHIGTNESLLESQVSLQTKETTPRILGKSSGVCESFRSSAVNSNNDYHEV